MLIKPKEAGYILAIDQASNAAGVALWKDGQLVGTTVLRSGKASDPIGKRLCAQIDQLTIWLAQMLTAGEDIKVLLFEGVQSKLVLITVGAFVTCPFLVNCKLHPRHSFIASSSWKSWAQKRGATGEFAEIKGIKALAETGYTVPVGMTDDEADAVMIYQCWRDGK